MRTVTTTKTVTYYSFEELSESAKQNAVEKLYDINVRDEWWDSTFDDAKTVGIKIEEFDIGRGSYCKGKIEDAYNTAEQIVKEHGEQCETYKTAKAFLDEWEKLVEKYSDGMDKDKVAEGNEDEFDQEADKAEEEFKKSILEDYRIILQNEYEYLTSYEAIIDTIEANDYEFTEDGKLA